MCPLEFVATPTASPITTLSGNFRKSGAESKGISGTEICANKGVAANTSKTTKQTFEKLGIKVSNYFDPQPLSMGARLTAASRALAPPVANQKAALLLDRELLHAPVQK